MSLVYFKRVLIKYTCIAALVLLYTIVFFYHKEHSPDNPDSIFAKKEWANLKSVNVQDIPILKLEHAKVIRFNGSDILVANHGECRILLNCNFPPYFKMFGNFGDCSVNREDLEVLRKKTRVTNTVLEVLWHQNRTVMH